MYHTLLLDEGRLKLGLGFQTTFHVAVYQFSASRQISMAS